MRSGGGRRCFIGKWRCLNQRVQENQIDRDMESIRCYINSRETDAVGCGIKWILASSYTTTNSNAEIPDNLGGREGTVSLPISDPWNVVGFTMTSFQERGML